MNDMIFEEINMNNKVYVKIDEQNRIIEINSDNFINDISNWIQIDEGQGDKYLHAQNNYFPLPIIDDRMIYRYKLVDGVPVERTQEEIDADYVEPEIPEVQTYDEQIAELKTQIEAQQQQLNAYELAYNKGVNEA